MLLPALQSWAAVPGGRVVTSDVLLARHLHDRFGVEVVPEGVPASGPTLRIPPLVDRGPAAVDAALRSFGRGRQILPDLRARWCARPWLGGWTAIASALAELDALCPPGPLHELAVRARRPELVAPPPPRLVLELWADGRAVGSAPLASDRVRLGGPGEADPWAYADSRVVHPTWPAPLGGRVLLAWTRDGVQVRAARAVGPWRVLARPSARGAGTPVTPDVPVALGCRGEVRVCLDDRVVARVVVRPRRAAPERVVPSPEAGPAGGLGRIERRVLVEVILEAAASTSPLADVVPALLSAHPESAGRTLRARLGDRPLERLSGWLAQPSNEALRLALADAFAQTDAPSAVRARLPRALRCWVPSLSSARPPDGLRLVVGGGPDG